MARLPRPASPSFAIAACGTYETCRRPVSGRVAVCLGWWTVPSGCVAISAWETSCCRSLVFGVGGLCGSGEWLWCWRCWKWEVCYRVSFWRAFPPIEAVVSKTVLTAACLSSERRGSEPLACIERVFLWPTLSYVGSGIEDRPHGGLLVLRQRLTALGVHRGALALAAGEGEDLVESARTVVLRVA